MRKNFLLDKEWRFLPGEGEVEAQKTHSDSYNSSKAGQERGIPSLALDDSSWRVVNIPHDYFTETEFKPENLISHGYKTRHNAWYRKSFKLPERIRRQAHYALVRGNGSHGARIFQRLSRGTLILGLRSA